MGEAGKPSEQLRPGSVLVVDDDADLRLLIRLALRDEPQLWVSGESGQAGEALGLAGELQPDFVILDLSLPGFDLAEGIPAIRAAAPRARVVVLSGHSDEPTVQQSIDLGAAAYLIKGADTGAAIAPLLRSLLVPGPD